MQIINRQIFTPEKRIKNLFLETEYTSEYYFFNKNSGNFLKNLKYQLMLFVIIQKSLKSCSFDYLLVDYSV